jgi:hypothetical protein
MEKALSRIDRCLSSPKLNVLMEQLYRKRFTFIKNHVMATDELMRRCLDDAQEALMPLKSVKRIYMGIVDSTTLHESLEQARRDTILAIQVIVGVFETFLEIEAPLNNINYLLEALQLLLAHHDAFVDTFDFAVYHDPVEISASV